MGDWSNTQPGSPERIEALHAHYASNAQARGHAPTCALVTDERNWPTIMGRPTCTCGSGR